MILHTYRAAPCHPANTSIFLSGSRLGDPSMRTTLALLTLCLFASPAFAKPKNVLVVPLKTSTGEDAGTATFKQGKKLTIKLDLKNLPVGDHAVHVHAKPVCDAPDFKTAGGHFNPENKQHGA